MSFRPPSSFSLVPRTDATSSPPTSSDSRSSTIQPDIHDSPSGSETESPEMLRVHKPRLARRDAMQSSNATKTRTSATSTCRASRVTQPGANTAKPAAQETESETTVAPALPIAAKKKRSKPKVSPFTAFWTTKNMVDVTMGAILIIPFGLALIKLIPYLVCAAKLDSSVRNINEEIIRHLGHCGLDEAVVGSWLLFELLGPLVIGLPLAVYRFVRKDIPSRAVGGLFLGAGCVLWAVVVVKLRKAFTV